MPVKSFPDPHVATLRAALEQDLDRLLLWRGPVTEIRRVVAELDRLDAQGRRAAATHADQMTPMNITPGEMSHAR